MRLFMMRVNLSQLKLYVRHVPISFSYSYQFYHVEMEKFIRTIQLHIFKAIALHAVQSCHETEDTFWKNLFCTH